MNLVTIGLANNTIGWFDPLTGINLGGGKYQATIDTDGKNITAVRSGLKAGFIEIIDGSLPVPDFLNDNVEEVAETVVRLDDSSLNTIIKPNARTHIWDGSSWQPWDGSIEITNGPTMEVNLDAAGDEVAVYGSNDGGATRQIVKTKATGELDLSTIETKLDTIATNTNNINVNVDTLEINTDGLENKLDTVNSNLSDIKTYTDGLESSLTSAVTALQLIDDITNTQNSVFVKGVPVMGQLDDVATTAATEDNVAAVRITDQRAVHANLRNNYGTEIGTALTPLRIDPTGTTSQPVHGSTSEGTAITTGIAIAGKNSVGNALIVSVENVLGVSQSFSFSSPIEAGLAKAGQLFSLTSELSIGGASETDFMLFGNPAGSGKVVYLSKVAVNSGNSSATWRFYANPTGTWAGTAITLVNQYIGNTNTSIATAISAPTGKTANGNKFFSLSSGTTDTSFLQDFNFGIILDPGNYVLVTGKRSTGSGIAILSLIWSETTT